MAIDTPLGFALPFQQLLTDDTFVPPVIGDSASNPYLFRQTERFLFAAGLRPLSAIKDMIGSQATKGMHVLRKFMPRLRQSGVWQDATGQFLAFEGYPSACRKSGLLRRLAQAYPALGHADKDDALTCALLAYLYDRQPAALQAPVAETPAAEGWIWVPKDALMP